MTEEVPQSALLALTDILECLPKRDLEYLAHRCPEIRLTEGQDLMNLKESYDQGIMVIKAGRLRLNRMGSANRPLTIVTLPAGTVLSTWHTQGLYVQALAPSILMYIGRQELKRVIRNEPEVGLRLIERLAEYVRLLADRLFDVTHKKVTSRLASLLLALLDLEGVVSRRGYEIPIRYTHEELGTMIGAQRVAVTRAFNFLRRVGALEVVQHHIRIKDTATLQSIAGEER